MAKRTGNPTVAIGYLRVSTEDQNLGIEAQRSAIVAWAMRNQVAVVAWHVDQGVSGSTELADRPAFVAALNEVKKHNAGVLVVAKRDRLARDVQIACMAESVLKEKGAVIVSADGVANGDGPADKFMRTVVNAASEYELGMIRLRTKAALAAKRAKGECAGEVPFGYRRVGDGKVLEENEEEQRIIRRIRELRALGVSLRAVAAKLAAEKLQSRAGKPLALTQVARIAA